MTKENVAAQSSKHDQIDWIEWTTSKRKKTTDIKIACFVLFVL